MDALKALISGVVIIGLATAIGLHGSGIATAVKGAGTATQGVLGVAEKG